MAKANLITVGDIQVTPRELDFVSRFEANWDHLREILGVLPEGITSVCGYLQMPEEYLQGKYPLENAIEQLTIIQTQLRLLMGE